MSAARELPIDELTESGGLSHPMWAAFGDNGTDYSLVGLYRQGISLLNELAEIRKAQGSAESKLATHDGPETITYREWEAKAKSKEAAIDEEYARQLADLRAQIATIQETIRTRKKGITSTLNEQKQKALSEIALTIKEDVNLDDKQAAYKTTSEQFNTVAKMLVDQPGDAFLPLKGFKLPGPGVAAGGTGKARTEGGKRFRWGQVTVSLPGGPLTLDQPTTKDIMSKVGIKDQDHFLNLLLTSLNGTWNNLPREGTEGFKPHTFEAGGHPVTLALRASTTKADTAHSDENTTEPVAA